MFFGLSAYVHSYVVENFNKNFFNRPWWESCNEVKEVLKEGLGGLKWEEVKEKILSILSELDNNINIEIYEPF